MLVKGAVLLKGAANAAGRGIVGKLTQACWGSEGGGEEGEEGWKGVVDVGVGRGLSNKVSRLWRCRASPG